MRARQFEDQVPRAIQFARRTDRETDLRVLAMLSRTVRPVGAAIAREAIARDHSQAARTIMAVTH